MSTRNLRLAGIEQCLTVRLRAARPLLWPYQQPEHRASATDTSTQWSNTDATSSQPCASALGRAFCAFGKPAAWLLECHNPQSAARFPGAAQTSETCAPSRCQCLLLASAPQ